MTVQTDKVFNHKAFPIIVFALLYVFIGFFAENKIVNPLSPNLYLVNIEIIVPILGAIIFGPLVGGGVAAIGELLLEFVFYFSGNKIDPLGFTSIFKIIIYFISITIVGILSTEPRSSETWKKLFFSLKTYYMLLINFLASLVGLTLLIPLFMGFAYNFYLTDNFLLSVSSFEISFHKNLILNITIVPLILIFYEILLVLRTKREIKIDKEFQNIELTTQTEGPGKVIKASFEKHAFRIGHWTPVKLKFKHTWKKARSYEIEAISTSRIHPNIDTTPVLKEGESWEQTFYVLPLKQEFVKINVRLTPKYTKKFKEVSSSQTVVTLNSPTYIKRDLLFMSVVFLTEFIIFLFIISIIWGQLFHILLNIIGKSEPQSSSQGVIPWLDLFWIGVVELILFIPFLIIMYIIQIPDKRSMKPAELAFSQDISSHQYFTNVKKFSIFTFFKIIFLFVISLAIFTFSFLGLYYLWTFNNLNSSILDININPTIFIFLNLAIVLFWVFSIQIFKNIWEFQASNRNYSLSEGKFLESIDPESQFQVLKPSEILMTIKNTSKSNGLRLEFKGNDTLSPQMIELHISKSEVARFKVGITPLSKGEHNILVIVYPLFDKDGNYISLDEARPIAYQNISYKVLGETIIGVTNSQVSSLKHIFGWGSLLVSTITFVNQYLGIKDILNQWKTSVPWIIALQLPFIYLYYLFSNKYITHIKTY